MSLIVNPKSNPVPILVVGSLTNQVAPLQNDGSGHYYTSQPIDLTDMDIMQIIMPVTWLPSVISFRTSDSQYGIYQPLYDDGGNEIKINVSAGNNIAVSNNAAVLAGLSWVKINSGSNSSLVDQTAARSIKISGKM